jgi:nicotinamidase-related amidase
MSAFVLTEVQGNVIGSDAPWPQLSEAAARVDLVGNAARLAEAARARHVPVIHCTAEHLPGHFGANANAPLFRSARKVMGSDGLSQANSQPHPGVYRDGDLVLPRLHGLSAMSGSPLDALLRNRRISTLVIGDVSLAFGVLSLVMDAVNHSYDVVIPSDAVAGFPEEYAQAVLDNSLRMLATISTSASIVAAWK